MKKQFKDLKIGDSVWLFDYNRRIYKKKDGFSYGGPIYRYHWYEKKIIGSTKLSWIVNTRFDIKHCLKIGKNKIRSHYNILLSEQELNDKVWEHDNICGISEAVRKCKDITVLRKVAEIIGYVENKS
jgi:hypothetical protein